jgi:hypothetical protein
MQSPYDSRIFTDFSVQVRVNGTSLEFLGGGEGDASTGEVSVAVSTQGRVPVGFHPGLLSFALITGQPDISALAPNVQNPFQKVRGEYHGIRRLDLAARGSLLADYRISPIENGRRTAVFQIIGDTNVSDVVSLAPAFEVWIPQGPGEIHGHFSMVWGTPKSEWVKGEVESEYRLPTEEVLAGVHYRRINFHLDADDHSVRQSETITLFTPEVVDVLATR